MSEPKFKIGDKVIIVADRKMVESARQHINKISVVIGVEESFGKPLYRLAGDINTYNLGYWRWSQKHLRLAKKGKLDLLKERLLNS